MASEFTERRLAQLSPIGARLAATYDGCTVFVSTVQFGGGRWTRVEADECEPIHYRGYVASYEAARRYVEGAPCSDHEPETAAHVDRQSKVVDGVTFTNVHSGQKRAYGDSFYEYEVTSDRPADHVEKVCRESVYPCGLSVAQWQDENRAEPSMSNHFRSHYAFEDRGNGRFFYRVTFPYAD